MKLYIPPLNTKMKLTAPWTFALYYEPRNSSIIDSLRENGVKVPQPKTNSWGYASDGQKLCDATLPIGTELTVKRIYIRTNQKGFDSVTFTAKHEDGIKGRFWVKLEDANKIEMEIV